MPAAAAASSICDLCNRSDKQTGRLRAGGLCLFIFVADSLYFLRVNSCRIVKFRIVLWNFFVVDFPDYSG